MFWAFFAGGLINSQENILPPMTSSIDVPYDFDSLTETIKVLIGYLVFTAKQLGCR